MPLHQRGLQGHPFSEGVRAQKVEVLDALAPALLASSASLRLTSEDDIQEIWTWSYREDSLAQ